MTRESLWRRFKAVEESRQLRRLSLRSLYVVFDGASWETKEASGPANFICRRHDGEPLDVFEARTDIEFRAACPRWPLPPVFVFGPDRDSSTKSIA
jgi:hypothetical protein